MKLDVPYATNINTSWCDVKIHQVGRYSGLPVQFAIVKFDLSTYIDDLNHGGQWIGS